MTAIYNNQWPYRLHKTLDTSSMSQKIVQKIIMVIQKKVINGSVVLFFKTWEYLGSELHDFAGPPRIDQELLSRPDMLASMINQLYNHSSHLKWYLLECIYVGHQENFAWSFHRYPYCLLSDDHYEKCYSNKYVPCHISLLTTSHSLYHSALLLKIAIYMYPKHNEPHNVPLLTYTSWTQTCP